MNQVLFALTSAAPALAAEPPATVLDHAVELTFSTDRTAERTTTWTVRIDDPSALPAGLGAPPGLDGAEDQGARVVDGLLLLPEQTAPGATLSLTASESLGRGPLSGVFQTVAKIPTEHASFAVTAPLAEPLSVWADPDAAPTFASVRGGRRIGLEWRDVASEQLGEAIWSTYASWDEASAGIGRTVDRKLADKEQLGRAVAQDIEGLGISGIVDRVFAQIALEPGPPGSWDSARRAADIAASARGNAAERGVVLIAALRAAGIAAEPAWFRSREVRGSLPITVPAPVLLPDPLVIVPLADGQDPVYIDPASQHAAVPGRPASLLGGTVWTAARPGTLPRALSSAAIDGEVRVSARLTVAQDGQATWSAEVEATGAAAEVVRQRLAPLDQAGRAGVFAALAGRSRPALDPARITVTARGVGRTDRELTVTVAGAEDEAMAPTPFGLRGDVAPLLAVALAAWLPPRIQVSETLAVVTPAAMRLIGSSRPEVASHPGAVVERTAVRAGPQVSLTTRVFRPSRGVTVAQHQAAAVFLGEQAPVGMDLLLLGEGRGTIPSRLRRADGLEPADRAVLEALVRSADPEVRDDRVRRVLARATGSSTGPAGLVDRLRPGWCSLGTPEIGFEAFAETLAGYVEPADGRVWTMLSDLAQRDADKITVALGLDAVGRSDTALDIGRALVGSEDPRVRLEAHLLVDRLQGPPPVEDLEPARAELWTDPVLLAMRGREAAATSANGSARPDPRPYVRAAELAVEDGRPSDAVSVVTGLDPEQEPLVAVLLARAAALDDLPAPEARRRILAAVARAPRDAAVTGAAADALAALGASIPPGEALAYALAAARLRGNADRWDRVVPVALAAGDLVTAADAARRSSDLDPESVVRARRWATLATMMLDREGAAAARERGRLPLPDGDESGDPTLESRLAMDESALLALLVHADPEVTEDPRLLAIRAELRIAAGLMDDAARDGLILAIRHGLPDGAALAFAATAGRQFSMPVASALDAAADSAPTAMMTRMEYRLVAGTGDPLVDARRLGDDPRARALVQATSQPLLAASSVEGWPREVPAPSGAAPEGYRANRALSAIAGVVGYSNPDAGTAVLRVGAVTGAVPPPIALLYTGRPRPVDSVEGGEVLRLDGGMMPLYAARAVDAAEQEVWGLGFTPEGAKDALAAVLER
jgi:hypothetical protein